MRHRYSPDREIEFAARVGFLTHNLWWEFFSYGHRSWRNKVWQRLKEEGFFRSHARVPNLYLPNAKHPQVASSAPYIAKPPVLGQLGHDELVARTYLLLKRELQTADLKTEAYLKKEVPISNKGVRVDDAQKHPDLILKMDGQKTALEIEITQKSRARYRSILRSFRSGGFKRVIYLIRSEGTMNAVESAALEVSFPRDQIQLGFGSIGEWRTNPLKTAIHFEHSTECLVDVLNVQSESKRSL